MQAKEFGYTHRPRPFLELCCVRFVQKKGRGHCRLLCISVNNQDTYTYTETGRYLLKFGAHSIV